MNKHEIAIYVLDVEHANEYISLIRQVTGTSISEILSEIKNNKPVIICKYTKNPDELKTVYSVLGDLLKKNAKIKIVQNIQDKIIREIDMNSMNNLIKRREEINQEVIDTINLDVGE